MKIFIAASWLKLGGGVTRTLLELFKHIDFSRHDLTLMLMELDEDVLPYVPKEVKVVWSGDSFQSYGAGTIIKNTLKKGKIFTAASYMLNVADFRLTNNNYRHQAWITKHMQKQDEEYDIAISYAMMNSIVNKYVIDNVKAKKKILWCHIDINIYKPQYIKGLGKLYNKYDRINCVSQSSLNSLKEKYPELSDKLHVAYNFIDRERIIRESELEPDADYDNDTPKICTIGRITDQKGIDILVDVADRLNKNGFNFVWWVVGTRYNDELNRRIESSIKSAELENKVLLLGEKNPPYPFISKCDIYVQPSRYEGYCTTTNEARILLKPVITTRVAGAEEQFSHNIDGMITDISVDAVYEAVAELLSSPEKRKQLTDNLQKRLRVSQEISFESMIL